MRSVIGCSLMRSLECTLATTTSSSASRSASWSRRPSSRMSTSTPVRMRNGASSSLSARHQLELRLEPLGVETVRDRERRRVVGEREVLRGRARPPCAPSARWWRHRRTSRSAGGGRPGARRGSARRDRRRARPRPRGAPGTRAPLRRAPARSTRAVLDPMPGRSPRRPWAASSRSSSSGRPRIASAALRNASSL